MAFDVYVGTMTRFYRNEWENAAQRFARETGTPYRMIHAGGEPEPPPPADEIREAVNSWRNGLSASLAAHGAGPLTWDEGDDQPYFSERPAWDGYSALLVWAAHAEHPDLPLPDEPPESWADDVAYQRSSEPGFKSRFRTILQGQLWLPAEFRFVFQAPTLVSDDPTTIGSTFTLRQQLDDLHARTSPLLARLTASQGASPGLARLAGFGLDIFRDLAAKACEYRLPILLHY